MVANYDFRKYLETIVSWEWEIKDAILKKLQEITFPLLDQEHLNFIPIRAENCSNDDVSHSNKWFSECKCRHLGLYIEALRENDLCPLEPALNENSIDELLTAIASVRIKFSPTDNYCQSCTHDMEGLLKELASSMEDYFPWLCLDCVRRGLNGGKNERRECQVPHKPEDGYGKFGLGKLRDFEFPWDLSKHTMGDI